MVIESVIRIMRLIERHFMRDDLRGIELACHNFLIQHRHVMNHGRLSHGQLYVSFPNVSEHKLVVFRTVYPRNLNRAEFPYRIHRDVDRAERSANQLGLLLFLLQGVFLPSIPTQSMTTSAPPLVISFICSPMSSKSSKLKISTLFIFWHGSVGTEDCRPQ